MHFNVYKPRNTHISVQSAGVFFHVCIRKQVYVYISMYVSFKSLMFETLGCIFPNCDELIDRQVEHIFITAVSDFG